MAFNTDRLHELAIPRSTKAVLGDRKRVNSREWKHSSKMMALSVYSFLQTRGLSNEEFAKRLGKPTSYVEQLLKASMKLSKDDIERLSRIIGLTISPSNIESSR